MTPNVFKSISFSKSRNDTLTIDEQISSMRQAIGLGYKVGPEVSIDGSITGQAGCITYNYRLTHKTMPTVDYRFIIADHEEKRFTKRMKSLVKV